MIEISGSSEADRDARSALFLKADAEAVPEPMLSQIKELRFTDARVESEFVSAYFARSLSSVRLNLILGMALHAVWALVDQVVISWNIGLTLLIRFGVACPVHFGIYLLTFTRHFERLMVPALLFLAVVNGGVLIWIIEATGPDGHHYYYAALMLCEIGVCACPGLRFRSAVGITLATFFAYEATLWADATSRTSLNNSMFLLTAELLAISVSYTLERQQRSDFLHRWIIHEQSEALQRALREVDRAARIDPLTGLYNRRHFFGETRERSGLISVILLDVDHFKAINDRFGHSTGDRVLRELADRVRLGIRPCDVACRYGGEEFAILLPGADLLTSAAIGERLRNSIANRPIEIEPKPLTVTVSVGVATVDDGTFRIEDLIDRADRALYKAKNGGRNRVKTWLRDEVAAGLP